MKLLALMILVTSHLSYALSLEDIQSNTTPNGQSVVLVFDQEVQADQFTVDFINETVQVNLPSVALSKGTDKKELNTETVKSLYTYRVNKDLARTRVIFKKGTDAVKYQPHTKLIAEGNKLSIFIDTAASTQHKVTEEDLKQATDWLEKAEQAEVVQKTADKLPVVQKQQANLKESEIPVLATAKKAVAEKKTGLTARVMASLGLVLALLFGFSFFAKKYFKKAPLNKNNQIKVLTQYYMGPRKSLAIVRVAGESILIGVTEQNISLIKTLALMDEDIPQDTPKDFSSTLGKLFKKEKLEMQDDSQDEFSMSKIKDFVSNKMKDKKEL